MRVVYNLVFTVMVILNFIELSTQFECLPNGAPIPGVPRGGSSSSASEGPNSPTRPHSSTTSSSHVEPPLRSRSRSPPAVNRTSPTRLPIINVLGYGLDQLEFIRLIPYKNPQRKFEFRRFNFPADEPVEVLEGRNKYRPIASQEYIALSTFDGDVFAILDSTDILAGIYTCNARKVRAKINMKNGKVTPLTADEARDTPVGRNRQILYNYRVDHLNRKYEYMALPTTISASDRSEYELDQLQFIRLIPKKNPNLIFELRRYSFPVDKLILLLEGHNRYGPIPNQELIVLTTVSGDVYAILESSNDLAGIYTYNTISGGKVRVKINIRSEAITQLTKREIGEVSVRRVFPIFYSFIIQHVNNIPPRPLMN